MDRLLPVLMIVGLGLFSCNKEVVPLTKEQINRKIDSIIKEGKEESDAQARIDLERRMKIEVKVKVDSILSAKAQPVKRDTARSNKAIPPKTN